MNWSDFRELLLKVFRNTPLSVTIHVLEKDKVLDSQASQPDSTLPACMGSDRIRDQTDDRNSSGESHVSEEVEASGVPTLRTDSPTRDLSMVSDARMEPAQKEQREGKPTQNEGDALPWNDAHPATDSPRENMNRYPRRERRRPDKFGDGFLCKLKKGN